jgi:hypothetical protein
MRWNVLFEELEHQFDQLGLASAGQTATPTRGFNNDLRASVAYAKAHQKTIRLLMRHSGVLEIRPRTIARDFVAGTLPSRGVDAALSNAHIVGFQPAASPSNLDPIDATLDIFMRVWSRGNRPCVVVSEGRDLCGFITEVADDSIRFSVSERGGQREWLLPRASLELVRTLSAAEKEGIDG